MKTDILDLRASQQMNDRSIGEIIKRAFGLSDDQVANIIRHQQEQNTRFGEAAVTLGYIKPNDVLWALSQQFEYPYSTQTNSSVSNELVLAINPFSDGAEIFRNLRSDIISNISSQPATKRSIAVLSAESGDGKSFFAANLAVAFSQLGARTLLIDADMRSPRQNLIFSLDDSHGLSSILSGRINDPSFSRPHESLPNLYVLPVGITPPNPLELLQKGGFSLLLAELQMKFDYVVIDTPAASHGSDSKVIASYCGTSLLIARKNFTPLKSIESFHKGLKNAGVNIFGILMNSY